MLAAALMALPVVLTPAAAFALCPKIGEIYIADFSAGSGNFIAEPGETTDISIYIENQDAVAIENAEITVTSLDPADQVVLSNGTQFVGTIDPFSRQSSTEPITITISATKPCNTLRFNVQVVSNGETCNLPLRDNGGTDFCGQDTLLVQTFIITAGDQSTEAWVFY
jgi:hypothetical protein